MKKVSLGLLISGHEVVGVNGLLEETKEIRNYEQEVKWEGKQIFGKNILEAYEKLTKIADEAYPDFNYRIIIEISKND